MNAKNAAKVAQCTGLGDGRMSELCSRRKLVWRICIFGVQKIVIKSSPQGVVGIPKNDDFVRTKTPTFESDKVYTLDPDTYQKFLHID